MLGLVAGDVYRETLYYEDAGGNPVDPSATPSLFIKLDGALVGSPTVSITRNSIGNFSAAWTTPAGSTARQIVEFGQTFLDDLAISHSVVVQIGAVLDKTNYGLADGAITAAKIAADAITAAKIADGAIDAATFAAGAINAAAIASDAITNAKLADGAISAAKIAGDAITAAKIADGAIDAATFAAGAINAAAIGNDAITAAKIADSAIDAATFAAGAINAAAIASDAITNAKLADGAISAAKIAADAITAAKIADGAIDTATFAAGAINAAAIADGAISAAKLGGDCITSDKIADNALQQVNFATGAVQIDDGNLTTAAVTKIAGGVLVTAANKLTTDASGNVTPTTASKTGYALAATGLDAITASEPTGKPTNFPGWLMWLVQRFRRASKSETQIIVKTEAGATVTTQTITSDGDDETLGAVVMSSIVHLNLLAPPFNLGELTTDVIDAPPSQARSLPWRRKTSALLVRMEDGDVNSVTAHKPFSKHSLDLVVFAFIFDEVLREDDEISTVDSIEVERIDGDGAGSGLQANAEAIVEDEFIDDEGATIAAKRAVSATMSHGVARSTYKVTIALTTQSAEQFAGAFIVEIAD